MKDSKYINFYINYGRYLRLYYLQQSMQKYQVWLQRKSHSQHLHNLIRIKQGKIERTCFEAENDQSILQPIITNNMSKIKSKSQQINQSRRLKKNEIHENSNVHGIKISRSYKGYNKEKQNQLMMKRIIQTKPVISFVKHKEFYKKFSSLKKVRRYNKLEDFQIRQENLNKFFNFKQRKVVQNNCNNCLKIIMDVVYPGKIPSANSYADIWCEIIIQEQKYKSELLKAYETNNFEFNYVLKNKIQQSFIIKVFYCKNLDFIQLGIFYLQPKFIKKDNQISIINRSIDKACEISIKVYQNCLKDKKSATINFN